jgi:hypothetical protein
MLMSLDREWKGDQVLGWRDYFICSIEPEKSSADSRALTVEYIKALVSISVLVIAVS